MSAKVNSLCQLVGGKRLSGNMDVAGSVQAQLALERPIHVGVKKHQRLPEGYNDRRPGIAMRRATMTDDDGTVEISEIAYRCLIRALRTISSDNYACCANRAERNGGHSPSCPVAIARKAMRDVLKASNACKA